MVLPLWVETMKILVACFLVFGFQCETSVRSFEWPASSASWKGKATATTYRPRARLALDDTTAPRMPDVSLRANRREFFESSARLAGIAALVTRAPSARADDALFRTNPLTNPVLEQIRIWDQAAADELKYGGELERGDAGNRGKTGAYARLLVPILQMANELDAVGGLIETQPELSSSSPRSVVDRWKRARDILKAPEFQKVNFKKTFNAYGDNIYFSDPDRANLYLGGGATPKNEQSLAYLLRNDILNNVEDLRAEVDYMIEHYEEESTDDMQSYARAARKAMRNYLELVPPQQLAEARKLMQDPQIR